MRGLPIRKGFADQIITSEDDDYDLEFMGDYTVLPPEVALITNEVCLLGDFQLSLTHAPELGDWGSTAEGDLTNNQHSKVGWPH